MFQLKKLDAIFSLFHTITYDRISTADEVALGLLITAQKTVHPLPNDSYIVGVVYENYGKRIHDQRLIAMHYALLKQYFLTDALKEAYKTRLFGHL
jgi:hypothetical protein